MENIKIPVDRKLKSWLKAHIPLCQNKKEIIRDVSNLIGHIKHLEASSIPYSWSQKDELFVIQFLRGHPEVERFIMSMRSALLLPVDVDEETLSSLSFFGGITSNHYLLELRINLLVGFDIESGFNDLISKIEKCIANIIGFYLRALPHNSCLDLVAVSNGRMPI